MTTEISDRKSRPSDALGEDGAGVRRLRPVGMLVLFLAATFGVSAFGAQFQPGEWYATLRKPAWTPPGVLFPIVWTALYTAMAVAAWLVWRTGREGVRSALWALVVQLALNGAWSWLFFGLQSPGLALLDIHVLLLAILVTTRAFRALSRAAGTLMAPYVVWVAFATVLNLWIWRLNG